MKSPFDGNIDKTSGDFQLRISLENCFAYGGDGVMRVLVIPDIHLKTWIFDRAEKIIKDGKADRAVCLMDIPDGWNMEFQIEQYKETFDRAIHMPWTIRILSGAMAIMMSATRGEDLRPDILLMLRGR